VHERHESIKYTLTYTYTCIHTRFQGHAQAQYNLGVMYMKGEGVTQDRDMAAHWWRKAVCMHVCMCVCVCVCMKGEGFAQDRDMAAHW
jgi:hypothetical protein